MIHGEVVEERLTPTKPPRKKDYIMYGAATR